MDHLVCVNILFCNMSLSCACRCISSCTGTTGKPWKISWLEKCLTFARGSRAPKWTPTRSSKSCCQCLRTCGRMCRRTESLPSITTEKTFSRKKWSRHVGKGISGDLKKNIRFDWSGSKNSLFQNRKLTIGCPEKCSLVPWKDASCSIKKVFFLFHILKKRHLF